MYVINSLPPNDLNKIESARNLLAATGNIILLGLIRYVSAQTQSTTTLLTVLTQPKTANWRHEGIYQIPSIRSQEINRVCRYPSINIHHMYQSICIPRGGETTRKK